MVDYSSATRFSLCLEGVLCLIREVQGAGSGGRVCGGAALLSPLPGAWGASAPLMLSQCLGLCSQHLKFVCKTSSRPNKALQFNQSLLVNCSVLLGPQTALRAGGQETRGPGPTDRAIPRASLGTSVSSSAK